MLLRILFQTALLILVSIPVPDKPYGSVDVKHHVYLLFTSFNLETPHLQHRQWILAVHRKHHQVSQLAMGLPSDSRSGLLGVVSNQLLGQLGRK